MRPPPRAPPAIGCGPTRRVAAAIEAVRAALRARSMPARTAGCSKCSRSVTPIPIAKTADGKPATRLTFGEKVRALELQGRALGFLKEQLEVSGAGGRPLTIVHQELP